MYLCGWCGAAFDRPAARRWSEPRPDGYRERFCQAVCPVCGSDELAEDGGEDGPFEEGG